MDEREILEKLNPEQQDAVRTTEGPVLILAGAGSGKTRVLVHRISYLINVCGVWPGNILAITFTNKAADEMRSRVDDLIGFGSDRIWVMTFHAACVRILRRHAEELGYTRYFTIYDTDDSLSVMKDIFRLKKIDTKRIKERQVLSMISSAKNELISPENYASAAGKDFFSRQVESLYAEYQSRLKANNAMDFDDLIGNTVKLFKEHPEVLAIYEEKFRYLMVDEYQDTNTAQFKFVSLLADKYRNLCVVGDDDQSIYKFRGANIRNILNFEQIFPESKVVRLEQNYRSTGNILNAANNVIRNNRGRKAKKLWTENETGAKVRFRRFPNSFDEAEFVADEIRSIVREGGSEYRDFAVLYRTNAQSRLFEEKFLLMNVPYKLVGGVNFYARKEIKDLLAYLKTTANAVDDVASTRIVNIPKRGIGQTTITKILSYAADGGLSFYEAAKDADRIGSLSAATVKKIRSFTDLIEELKEDAKELSVSALLRKIVEATDYENMLREQDDEDVVADRLGNIEELVNKAIQYETENENPSLSGFLEEVALIADIDSVEDGDDRVLLMTLHSAKGLEFPNVYLTGMEEGVFPGMMSLNAESPLEEIEEERRLCYVGITRAKKRLTMTAAGERMVRGNVERHPVSRFVREIPRDMLDNGLPESGSGVRLKAPSAAIPGFREAVAAPPPKYDNPYIRREKKEPSKSAPKPFAGLDYKVGDRVRHVKYGTGVVTEIREGKRDYEVTVDFQGWGSKRLLAAFANLVREE